MLSENENDEQKIIHNFRPHIVSVPDLKKYDVFTTGH